MTRQQINVWRAVTWFGIISLTIAFWAAVAILIKELFFSIHL